MSDPAADDPPPPDLTGRTVGEFVNLGTTRGASVKEIIDLCKEVTGKDFAVERKERREGDPAVLVANADKAKALLGWEATTDLRAIVETAWNWERNRRY